jgi:DNA-binding transcriptional LysR family regulator
VIKIDFDERDLRALRVFCSVAQAGGFASAEKLLLMSKASISRHIREVEERLGVRLCQRGPAGFKLTPEGEVALKLASSALRSLESIRAEIDAVHGVRSGCLSIGIGEHTVSHSACRFPEALALLRQRAPEVRPELTVMSFPELNNALREHRVDIGIRGKYLEDPDFEYVELFPETHRVYVSKRAKKPACDLLPLIYRPHPYVQKALATGKYKPGPDATGIEAIGVLVATGHYQGLLPVHYGDGLERRYGLRIQEGGPAFSHPICAVTNSARPLMRRSEVFLEILKELHPAVSASRT